MCHQMLAILLLMPYRTSLQIVKSCIKIRGGGWKSEYWERYATRVLAISSTV